MWVDLGKWAWGLLSKFGNWMYDNYIEKYLVKPFKQYIWEPAKKFWETKVWPVIQPFVQSLTELKDKIVKAFSAWDPNKSVWDNLKNIGSILKDTIVEWWENSPFKVFYETYIKPLVMSAADLVKRLMNLGTYLKEAILSWWNGDSSLAETLGNIGGIVWQTIVDWWEGSVFKTYWEKLKVYFDDMVKPLVDWYNESDLKKGVDALINTVKLYVVAPLKGLIRKFNVLKVKLAKEFSFKIPNLKWVGIRNGGLKVSFDTVHPFKFLTGGMTEEQKLQVEADADKSPTELINDEMQKMQKTIDDATKVNVEPNVKPADKAYAQAVALQQAQQAAQPLQNIEGMQNGAQAELQKNSQEVSVAIAKKEDAQQKRDQEQALQMREILNEMRVGNSAILKNLNDPYVVPLPLPMQQQQNPAMMRND